MKRIVMTFAALLAMAVPAMAGHVAAVGQGTCSFCHKNNLITQHGGFAATVCQTCHNSTNQDVMDTITAGVAGQQYACSNCHGAQSHLDKHGDYVANFSQYNGVQPNATAAWTSPTGYTAVQPATKEYQLCYKCHSTYAFSATNGVSAIVGPSGKPFTDKAREFNPANASAHPVQVPLNSQTGSAAPRALRANQMKAPWTAVGTQVMKCSDCHTPGSTGKSMLITGTTWPARSDGKLWTLGDVRNNTGNWQTTLFCAKCHPLKGSGGSSGWYNNVHSESDHENNVACVACHSVSPHGLNHGRFIGYNSDPAPYAYIDSTGKKAQVMTNFRKASSPTSYGEGNCTALTSACDEHR
ncbi:cytochrome C [Geobacter sulfurreducens]|uniref:Cytochrome c n=1 Tax=Geobacter sulfurreducens (strain ATCC 51573 / DSM 12127 / PCA) TaxID=243231 RepID=I7EF63_GEOSL|nr:cytochrome c [Geobacter sulfurreducens]ADI85641.1 cytochrome c, 7 heme-binding sites [Geobacter sulfurreducens KN400]AFP20507.1 cytochrome c [Geobacter sulfurreducens PCA]UAC03569.1 cytochrome C [Geobacter sulfurreducens]HCD95154.1 cytochrome C [Geobacter sulfurreducens]